VVDEERMMPGHWSELVLCIPFSSLTLLVGWQERHLAITTLFYYFRGFLLEQVEKDLRFIWKNGH